MLNFMHILQYNLICHIITVILCVILYASQYYIDFTCNINTLFMSIYEGRKEKVGNNALILQP